MFCGAKLTVLFAFLYYLFSGNDNFSEKWRKKSEKIRVQKETTTFLSKIVVSFWCRWWESNPHGITTTGFWVQRVCQFHHTCMLSSTTLLLYYIFFKNASLFLNFFKLIDVLIKNTLLVPQKCVLFKLNYADFFSLLNIDQIGLAMKIEE